MEEKEKLEKHLKGAGLRVSSGCETVFQTVMHTHGHFTAEELVKICQRSKHKVSRATVYRNLKELLVAGVIRETAFGEKHRYFEHVYDEQLHHHARCIRCHDLIEFPDLKEDKVYVPYLENKGFQILGHEMHFYGVCKQCQVKNN